MTHEGPYQKLNAAMIWRMDDFWQSFESVTCVVSTEASLPDIDLSNGVAYDTVRWLLMRGEAQVTKENEHLRFCKADIRENPSLISLENWIRESPKSRNWGYGIYSAMLKTCFNERLGESRDIVEAEDELRQWPEVQRMFIFFSLRYFVCPSLLALVGQYLDEALI